MSDASLRCPPGHRTRLCGRRGGSRAITALVAGFLLLSGSLGCASGLFRSASSITLTGAWGLAVYPIIFHFRMPQYQAFLRAQAIANRLNKTSSCLVYGPADFHVTAPAEPDVTLGSDLGSSIRYTVSRPPMGMYAIRVTVDRTGVTEADQDAAEAAGGDPNSLIAGGDIVVRVDLLSLGEHGIVTSVEGSTTLSGEIGEDIGVDQYPEITALTDELVDRILKVGQLQARQDKPALGLTTVPVLGPAAAFHLPGRKNLVTEMTSLDPIEREVILSGLTRLIDPGASRDRERLYGSSPFGLVVTAVDGVAKRAGLMPNDLLLTVDSERLWGRYVLDRHLDLGPSRVLFKRAGEVMEVTLAYPNTK